jgi:glucose/mannose-6-phosphate isomerase
METDKSNMLRILKDFPEQCKEAMKLGRDIMLEKPADITVTGMGGSAFAGDVLKCLLMPELYVAVNKNYTIPPYIGNKSLLIASSYSGNTEETLAACEKAISKGAEILGICKGGRLEKLCRKNGFPSIKIPEKKNMQTRSALGYMVIPVLNALQNSGLIRSMEEELEETIEALGRPSLEKRGREIASELEGKIPLIYTPAELYCIGYGWAKTRLNETSKLPSFYNEFPNMTHDEISLFQHSRPEFHAIFFIDRGGEAGTRKRMELSSRMIREKAGVTVINLEGSVTEKIFTSLHIGDWASYYLALAGRTDPTPVPMQERIKKIMQNNIL